MPPTYEALAEGEKDEQEDEDEQPLSKRMRHLQEKISQEEVKVSCAMLLAPPALA